MQSETKFPIRGEFRDGKGGALLAQAANEGPLRIRGEVGHQVLGEGAP